MPRRRQSPSIPARIASGLWIAAICLAVSLAGTRPAAGQALATASRESSFAAFGQATYFNSDYRQPSNFGYTVGVDAAPILMPGIQPSFELRITGDSGPVANEYTYNVGIKVATTLHGIHPYATVLGGVGTVYINHPSIPSAKGLFAHDSSEMFALAGGAEFDAGPSWQLLLDYSRQYWSFDQDYNPALPLRPVALSVGISYRFRSRGGGFYR
jgi:hypothetical protein